MHDAYMEMISLALGQSDLSAQKVEKEDGPKQSILKILRKCHVISLRLEILKVSAKERSVDNCTSLTNYQDDVKKCYVQPVHL